MDIAVKSFDELTTVELYEILKARAAIFVVEQNCVYQDLDDVDYQSLHVFYQEDNRVLAYLRAFYKEKGVVQIGRVLTMQRGNGWGGKLLHEGLIQIQKRIPAQKIYIEAQKYVIGYYQREGFQVTSEPFLEDGIEHVQMKFTIKKGSE
ncbi:MAG: GNAT family N-acetyltransferase [Absicoccus porci]|uniref:GNAT family N-acetyltransferase n=1 Tax=Absicoccus porci TaxID=2486576 RepID=UPI0023520F8E|nr:GNAT family N-acetyltransferase [Absicoccus porci]MCI6088396.1 GNAT family N-acetyltransferase [Absicoccus porci]MDD7330903.1 GNAT family N-acetyltransferase [Absicoccus porci]MDY4737941.1 GNAT family N-acetyltransferase [Absicoccus porci]